MASPSENPQVGRNTAAAEFMDTTATETLPAASGDRLVTQAEGMTTPQRKQRQKFEKEGMLEIFRWQALQRGRQICPPLSRIFDPEHPGRALVHNRCVHNAEQFLIVAKNQIHSYYGNDMNKLCVDLSKAGAKLVKLEKAYSIVTLPLQIIYGLMLNELYNSYKSEGRFLEYIKKIFPQYSQRTLYNYMNAAKIVDYPGNEKAYTSGLVILYKLVDLYKNNKIHQQNFEGLVEKFRECVDDIRSEDLNEETCSLVTQYVVYNESDFKDYPPEKSLMKSLFEHRYSITSTDVKRIRKYSVDMSFKGKNKPVTNKDFINTYFQQLITDNLDSGKAYRHLTSAGTASVPAQAHSQQKHKKFSAALAALKHVAATYVDDDAPISETEYADIQSAMELLQHIKACYENQGRQAS